MNFLTTCVGLVLLASGKDSLRRRLAGQAPTAEPTTGPPTVWDGPPTAAPTFMAPEYSLAASASTSENPGTDNNAPSNMWDGNSNTRVIFEDWVPVGNSNNQGEAWMSVSLGGPVYGVSEVRLMTNRCYNLEGAKVLVSHTASSEDHKEEGSLCGIVAKCVGDDDCSLSCRAGNLFSVACPRKMFGTHINMVIDDAYMQINEFYVVAEPVDEYNIAWIEDPSFEVAEASPMPSWVASANPPATDWNTVSNLWDGDLSTGYSAMNTDGPSIISLSMASRQVTAIKIFYANNIAPSCSWIVGTKIYVGDAVEDGLLCGTVEANQCVPDRWLTVYCEEAIQGTHITFNNTGSLGMMEVQVAAVYEESWVPTHSPTPTPTPSPTPTPTPSPTPTPTVSPTPSPTPTPTAQPTDSCAEITRGNLCRGRNDCWFSEGTCKDLVCEVATNRRQCMKVFPRLGLTCRYRKGMCMTFDLAVCITLTRAECLTSEVCEFNFTTKECVDKGTMACTEHTKPKFCNKAVPNDYPPGCKFDKVSKTCANRRS